mmetsp:Transcript_14396/g.33284  ORF Transcript_14396/g.33284 Transcript_14396/m.33284 type:complete len:234 (-) Transcript_14396:477-1178(-)
MIDPAEDPRTMSNESARPILSSALDMPAVTLPRSPPPSIARAILYLSLRCPGLEPSRTRCQMAWMTGCWSCESLPSPLWPPSSTFSHSKSLASMPFESCLHGWDDPLMSMLYTDTPFSSCSSSSPMLLIAIFCWLLARCSLQLSRLALTPLQGMFPLPCCGSLMFETSSSRSRFSLACTVWLSLSTSPLLCVPLLSNLLRFSPLRITAAAPPVSCPAAIPAAVPAAPDIAPGI